jgi:tryptophanyl-tRNA synthetase
VADIEAYEDNGIPLKESASTAISNVADMLALGLDTKRAYVYKQSDEKHVQRLAYLFARHVTYATMKAIYGEKSFGHYFSALIQVGDILLPQLPEFGGPKPTVVPIGADQDPHIRLTRDLAQKFQSEYGFILPGALYHKLARSLSGDIKMSKREPMSLLTLSDDPELAKKKITLAFTGGRETVAKQRELGGEPENCVVYELFVFHFVENDREVKRIYDECKSGRRLCGECKNLLADIVAKFLYEHQKKKAKLISNAEEILTSKGG